MKEIHDIAQSVMTELTIFFTMSEGFTKAHQQEIVADFIYEKKLELCMYIYLDAFLDIYHSKCSQNGTAFDTRGIRAVLEVSYQGIRDDIKRNGLLTEKAAGKYMMGL